MAALKGTTGPWKTFAVISLILIVCSAEESWLVNRDTQTLYKILGDINQYNVVVRPRGNQTEPDAGLLPITMNMLVRSISDFSDDTMDYKMQITLRREWRDERLVFDMKSGKTHITLQNDQLIWKPDTFFSNEIEGHFHEITQPNVLVRVFPDGRIMHSLRLTMTLACPMNLKNYPFDRQICSVVLGSYAHTTEDIIYKWSEENPLQVSRNLHIRKFNLVGFFNNTCRSRTKTGSYSCLKADFAYERVPHTTMIKVFIPCAMLVLLSWIPLWLNPKATLLRFLVPLLVLLAMANAVNTLNQHHIPQTGYVKSVDIWTGTCLTFVFAMLLEVTTVDYVLRVYRKDQDNSPLNTGDEMAVSHTLEIADGKTEASAVPTHRSTFSNWLRRRRSAVEWIDLVSRVIFPAAFVLFVIIYRCCYTSHE